jgi:hypothetical protein
MCWEKFEDTKGVINIRQSKKDRQHNGKKTHTQKTTDRATRTPLKTGMHLGDPEW